MPDLQDFKDLVAKEIFGTTVKKVQSEGLCIDCREPALPKCYSEAGKREYRISGLCEECFDRICEGGD